jgi:hypothetical protein
MPLVLTTNALVQCVHGGPGTTVPISPIWTVNGGFVAAEGDTGTIVCPFVLLPCLSYTLKSMHLNATQRDGQQVILVTDFQQSDTGLPLLITDFHETYDNSSPAPIPSGQAAPAPSAAMADLLSPQVVATPPSTPFILATDVAPVAVSFNLITDHPMKWILRLITAVGLNFDITSGFPTATITPSGGGWTSPSQSVSVTFPAVTVKAWGAGTSHLYMTGVSQRGLNGSAEAKIVAS